MKKKSLITAAIAVVAVLTAVILVSVRNKDYKTYTASLCEVEQTYGVTGVFMRTEQELKIDSGAVSYLVSDGEKVAKGQELARIYSSNSDVENARSVGRLTRELEDLKDVTGGMITSAVTPETIVTGIATVRAKLAEMLLAGDASGAAKCRSELTVLLNRYDDYFGEGHYADRISELEDEIASLKRSMGSYKSVYSPSAGYFYSYSDGKTAVSEQQLSLLSVDAVKKLISECETAGNDEIPKLVTEYRWAFAFVMPTSKAVSLGTKRVNLRFIGIGDEIVTATLEGTQRSGSAAGETAILVSSLNDIETLGGLRVEDAEVILSTVKGLRIPARSLRTITLDDGSEQMGVFAIVGPKMVFRKVSVLLSDGEFAVCEDVGKSGWLKNYDEIIIEGKDLYDGKTV